MKNLVLTLVIALTSLVSNAQLQKLSLPKTIKVGEVKPAGVFIAGLDYYISEVDSSYNYTLTYRNGKYQSIDSYEDISFKADASTIEELYKIFADAFKSDDIKSYKQELTLGKYTLSVEGYKMMGIKGVRFYAVHPSGVVSYINPITETQLNKLFGKI